MNEMKRSWLVQRLRKPYRWKGEGDPPPVVKLMGRLSFGGGRTNGGLSDEAWEMLREVFEFDYMGASEFEWGALPDALRALAAAKKKLAFTFTVPLAEVPRQWRDKSEGEPTGHGRIFVLCADGHATEAAARIDAWARDSSPDLLERLNLTDALRPREEWDERTCGWLELNNGFMFFTDQEMWEKTCSLFGVKTPAVATEVLR